MDRFFGGRPITLYTSGTAALAQAILRCSATSASRKPEVIIPAYGCPDLVAACIYAGVFPRLVDVAQSSWFYDIKALRAAICQDTIGIVAVNLLGLGDDADSLKSICALKGIALIQDSAQCLPRAPQEWPGDYVVLSFGRGKPLNLLHGGALISCRSDAYRPPTPTNQTIRDRLIASRAAAIAFNILTHPAIYGTISGLPGIRLGRVAYKPLANAEPLPQTAWRRVGPAFDSYRRHPSYCRDIWAQEVENWSCWGISTLTISGLVPPPEPIRLALLAPNREARDLLVSRLNEIGLGASPFYASDLRSVAGIPADIVQQGPFPNASLLAERLFTLPTHTLVTPKYVKAARQQISSWHEHNTFPADGNRRRIKSEPL